MSHPACRFTSCSQLRNWSSIDASRCPSLPCRAYSAALIVQSPPVVAPVGRVSTAQIFGSPVSSTPAALRSSLGSVLSGCAELHWPPSSPACGSYRGLPLPLARHRRNALPLPRWFCTQQPRQLPHPGLGTCFPTRLEGSCSIAAVPGLPRRAAYCVPL